MAGDHFIIASWVNVGKQETNLTHFRRSLDGSKVFPQPVIVSLYLSHNPKDPGSHCEKQSSSIGTQSLHGKTQHVLLNRHKNFGQKRNYWSFADGRPHT